MPCALRITLDVDRIARRLARALAKRPDDEREMLMRGDIDAAIAHFIEVLQTP